MKIAIITGSGQGIGFEIALRLTQDEYFVVIADINEKEGRKAFFEIGEKNCRYIPCDVGDEESVKQLYETIINKYGTVDVLVNNAGIIKDNMIWKMAVEDFDKVIRVNLRGTWLMCREAAIVMKKQNYGRIINISSRAWLGNRGQSNYTASKAGIIGLTRVLALELGRNNITVNAVAPGLIDTPLTQNLKEDVRQKLIEAQPTKTIGKPGDIADLVSFLASEKAGFITGQVIHVDGGKSIGAGVI